MTKIRVLTKSKINEFLNTSNTSIEDLPSQAVSEIWEDLQFQVPFKTSSKLNITESRYHYLGLTYVAFWESGLQQDSPITIGVLKR